MANILVADDDPRIRMLLRDFLEGSGHEVLEAGDTVEAEQAFRRDGADLVIADIHMPGGSGTELLSAIKASRPDVPVVIITGEPSVGGAVECIKSGASDFLAKPIDFKKLADVVGACLAPPADDNQSTMVLMTHSEMRFIAGYEIIRTLGYGNYGVVYLARKDTDSPEVALKVLRERALTGEAITQDLRDRFDREAEVAASLQHENIVRIYEFNVAKGIDVPYISMEYVKGVTLKTIMLEKRPLTVQQKAAIIRQVALALGAIHSRGLCHRDVKPQNMMVDDRYQVKLTDFGIVKTPDSMLTRETQLVGTPSYMAPEAYVSAVIDHRADLFSLGIVAYELLVGRLPFGQESLTALAAAIRDHKPIEPRKVVPELPWSLQTLLARLLKKSPDERYQSADEVVNDLDRYLSGEAANDSFVDVFRRTVFRPDWT